MIIKNITVETVSITFDDRAKKIFVFDPENNFFTVSNYLFWKNGVHLFDPIFLPHISCEVFGYGHTVSRRIETDSSAKFLNKTILRHVELFDETRIRTPFPNTLTQSAKRLAEMDFHNFFYGDIDENLCFFSSTNVCDYVKKAERHFFIRPESGKYGFEKNEWKAMKNAMEEFKSSFSPIDLGFREIGFAVGPFGDYHLYTMEKPIQENAYTEFERERLQNVSNFFIANNLIKNAYDAIGKDVPPLFLFNAIDELGETAVRKIVELADMANRQVLFVEAYDNELDPTLFDQTISFMEEE